MLLVAAMAAAAMAVGCGDDDESTGGGTGASSGGSAEAGAESDGELSTEVTTASISKEQFVKRAKRICDQGRGAALSYQPPGESSLSESELVSVTIEKSIAPSLRQVVAELQALGAPSGEEEQIEAFLEALLEGIEDLEDQRGSISSLEEVEESFTESGKLAREAGIALCAFG